MAETSWPFSGPDSQRVDAPRWQTLIAAGATTGVLGRWGDSALSVSVSRSQTGAVDVAPGKALVRGFAYALDQVLTLPLSKQTSTSAPRIDLVVLELDVAGGKVSARVLKGQPGSTPRPPGVTQITGGIWQYPLAQVTVRRKETAVDEIRDVRTLVDSGRPPAVRETQVPTNPTPGDLIYYRSDATNAEELHMYAANGGWSIVGSIGKARTYTPRLSWDGGSYRAKGHFQWMTSNFVWVTINITNTSGRDWQHRMNISLPTKSRGGITQVLQCTMHSPRSQKPFPLDPPTYSNGTAIVTGGASCQPIIQTYGNYILDTDSWLLFPKDATMSVSGVFEADYFHEGN